MPMFQPTTYQMMRNLLVVAGASRRKMNESEMDDSLDRRREFSWQIHHVRAEARYHAIGWLEGATPKCRTIHRLCEEAKAAIPVLCQFSSEQERQEYRQEFLWEVQSRVDAMIGLTRH